LYYPDTIERLMSLHGLYHDAVCTNRTQIIGYKNGKFTKSNYWPEWYEFHSPDHVLLGLGYSGVLYPPSFRSEGMYDIEQIKKLSLMADDMWLKVHELLNNVKVVKGFYYAHPVILPSSQKIALRKTNNAENSRNDKYLQCLNEYYRLKEVLSDFLKLDLRLE